MSDHPDSSAALFANYQEYNKTLRTWFVTFGLGAPAVFLINHDLAIALKSSGKTALVAGFYLFGCVIQVVVAMLNKFIAWHAYDAIAKPNERRLFRRCLATLNNEFRIDMSADMVTAVAFALATGVVFVTFAL